MININNPTIREYPRVAYFRLDGAQGSRIGVRIDSEEVDKNFALVRSKIPPGEKLGSALKNIISELGLKRADT